ncbi:MAG: HpcH/HpaI aldolase/citrate lyase family protein [Candidatus Hodarchaeota archaeon]
MVKSLRQKLTEGQSIVGVMVQDYTNTALMPVLADAGYDFIVIDQEHGPSDHLDIQNLVMSSKHLDIDILVRSTKISYEYMAKILDMGAHGLMIPHVDDWDDAQRVIKYSKYPPVGERSYGMRRFLSKHIEYTNAADYIKQANENTTLFVQVESAESAAVVGDILGINYIDGVIIGPSDLTMDLGIIGEYENEKFVKMAEKVLLSCKNHNKAFGIHFGNLELTKVWKEKGMNILLHSNISGLIRQRAGEVISELKGKEFKQKKDSGPY